MSGIRTMADHYRNEPGLVDQYIGTGYDTVKRVSDNLPSLANALAIGTIKIYSTMLAAMQDNVEGDFFAIMGEKGSDILATIYKIEEGEAVVWNEYPSAIGAWKRANHTGTQGMDTVNGLLEQFAAINETIDAIAAKLDDDCCEDCGDGDGGSDMSGSVVYVTLAELKALTGLENRVVFLTEAGRSGAFICKAGVPPVTDTLEGIYIKATTGSFYYERAWDQTIARPEWFGAKTYPANENYTALASGEKTARLTQATINVDAIHACRDMAPITQLANGRYYTDDCIYWNKGDRTIRGAAMRYGFTEACTEIVLTGTNATDTTVFQFGAADYASVVRGQFCEDIAFNRTAKARGSTTGDVEDCVKGVLYRWTTNSEMKRCRSFGSPIGFHVTNTATSNLIDCNVDPGADAASTDADIIIAFLLGGYTKYPGFVAANGSLRVEGCTAFAFGDSDFRVFMLVYGFTADTWMDKCEAAIGGHGLMITGIDKASMIDFIAGTPGPYDAFPDGGASQDITVTNCRIDGFSGVGYFFHHLPTATSINVHNPYGASNDTGFALNNIEGRVNIDGGEILASAPAQGGIDAQNVQQLRIAGIYIRDFAVPVQVANCVGAEIRPVINNWNMACTTAINLENVDRCVIEPMIRGAAAKITNGVKADSFCTFNGFNLSGVDPGCFVVVDKQYKIRYNNADASTGGGAFASAGNALFGVLG